MAVGQISQVLDMSAISMQLHSSNSGVMRDMLRRGLRVQARARRRAPANSGRLRGSIEVATVPRVVSGVSTYGVIVGTNLKYARWVHDGTGIYGPHRTPIRPTHSSQLVFKGRNGKMIHVSQVKGQRANPFLKNALAAARGRGGAT
jgi:HK97 gp10 family phage protein